MIDFNFDRPYNVWSWDVGPVVGHNTDAWFSYLDFKDKDSG